jgi:hypothetical protein
MIEQEAEALRGFCECLGSDYSQVLLEAAADVDTAIRNRPEQWLVAPDTALAENRESWQLNHPRSVISSTTLAFVGPTRPALFSIPAQNRFGSSLDDCEALVDPAVPDLQELVGRQIEFPIRHLELRSMERCSV